MESTTIPAANVMPGMILAFHRRRGPVASVIARGDTPWGAERFEVEFQNGGLPLLITSDQRVRIEREG